MAEVAIQFVMDAFQFVIGVFIVVKNPRLPIIGVVALSTVFAKAAFVFFIILFMAIVALAGGILILVAEMALLARGDGVLADERKLGDVVVKKEVAAPAFFVVALLALFALLAAMDILGFMTSITFCFELFFKDPAFVATFTRQIGVFTDQRKFGVFVMVKIGA